ncbi:MAG: hypothetical protein OXU23_07570 [Candidatus Poribacteria bacterium]|nr:hypothetical protein [Candidatus Poribacteria bacterium]
MYIIRIKFDRLRDVRITDLIEAVGVYVIWDGRAKSRPSYIGEGRILRRFSEHANRFAKPFDGYIGILGDDSTRTTKQEAEIVEALLIHVAEEVDRAPSANKAPGKFTGLTRIFRSHGHLRIRVSGYDPLSIPGQTRRLSTSKVIELKLTDYGVLVNHTWRKRRKQR